MVKQLTSKDEIYFDEFPGLLSRISTARCGLVLINYLEQGGTVSVMEVKNELNTFELLSDLLKSDDYFNVGTHSA